MPKKLLTDAQLAELFERWKAGEKQSDLARAFGFANQQTVSYWIRKMQPVVPQGEFGARTQARRPTDNATPKIEAQKPKPVVYPAPPSKAVLSPSRRYFAEGFWQSVGSAQEGTGCRIWLKSVDEKGYGQILFEHRNRKAHIVAWILTYGDIPDGLCVCHKCDVANCVNPDHLWLGTQLENMRDMAAKGRRVTVSYAGAQNGNARATTGDVEEIRRLRKQGHTIAAISIMFGISESQVGNIVAGRQRVVS